MKVIMKVQLANSKGVFNPGDEYEDTAAKCQDLILYEYAYDPSEPGPEPEPEPEELETAEAEPVRETAAKRTYKPRKKRKKK